MLSCLLLSRKAIEKNRDNVLIQYLLEIENARSNLLNINGKGRKGNMNSKEVFMSIDETQRKFKYCYMKHCSVKDVTYKSDEILSFSILSLASDPNLTISKHTKEKIKSMVSVTVERKEKKRLTGRCKELIFVFSDTIKTQMMVDSLRKIKEMEKT